MESELQRLTVKNRRADKPDQPGVSSMGLTRIGIWNSLVDLEGGDVGKPWSDLYLAGEMSCDHAPPRHTAPVDPLTPTLTTTTPRNLLSGKTDFERRRRAR